ncbi:MAG: hypothetical protein IKL22_11015 [Lachnospiraceae bacterium]|nr:hypothetical protein [Lachnospiraceae bacterium]
MMFQLAKKYRWQLLIILGILVIQLVFAFQKEGYHMDELISFEMANAEYNPWIVPTQPVGRLAKFVQEEIEADSLGEKLGNISNTIVDVLKNRGNSKMLSYKADVYEEPVWISKAQFRDYLTTDGTDSFNYLSVYFNVKDDNHPPVHFMLLHTISSLFVGKIHPVMGCVINIFMIICSAIVIMKCGMMLDKYGITSDGKGMRLGMLSALLYGCSQASVATMLLIRMYGVLTFLCLLTFYLQMDKWWGRNFDKKNKLLIFVTVLGFWTQYFFLFYCIALSLAMVLALWRSKRIKELLVYIRSMLIAALIGVVGYPFAISDVFSSSRGVEALGNLRGGLGQYIQRLAAFGEILLDRCFGNWVFGLIVVLAFLTAIIFLFIRQKLYRTEILLYCVPVLVYFLLAAKMSPMYVDRYLMAVFPFVISWLVVALSVKSPSAGKTIRTVMGCLLVCYCLIQLLTYDGSYLYKGYQEQVAVSQEYKEKSCICLYEGSGYYDNLMEFINYEKTLLVTPEELKNRKDTASVLYGTEFVMVVKNTVSQEQVEAILNQYDWNIKEILIEEGAHKDKVYLCENACER